jgi:hypothetical protein
MGFDPKHDVHQPHKPKHGEQSRKQQAATYDKARIAVSNSQRKKAPVTLPSVKSFVGD